MSSFRAWGVLGLAAILSAVWFGCSADAQTTGTGDDGTDSGTGGGGGGDPPPADQDGGVVYLDAGLGGGGDTDAGGGGGGTMDGGGGGGGLMCKDTNDVGGTEATAKVLPGITDNDSDAATVTGIVDGILDVDQYSLAGADTSLHQIDATATTPTAGVEMCMFAKCQKGVMNFMGCSGGTQAKNDIGMDGCCLTAPGTVVLSHNCTGTTDDSLNTFIRVKDLKNVCTPYSVTYHF
jgi:hypothetical protein